MTMGPEEQQRQVSKRKGKGGDRRTQRRTDQRTKKRQTRDERKGVHREERVNKTKTSIV
jgi:hypothetical protein